MNRFCNKCGAIIRKPKNCSRKSYERKKYCSVNCSKLDRFGTNEDRFRKYADIREKEECWIWKGGLGTKGYGKIRYKNKVIGAHKFSYILHTGDENFTRWDKVCHTCDNPPCVNPYHVYKGTDKTNAQDRIRRGCHLGKLKLGENINTAKLTANDVISIRETYDGSWKNRHELAELYGVTPQNIKYIVDGKSWKHLL